MTRKENKHNETRIIKIAYISWTALFLIFCFVVIPIANIGHSGGEQVPLTLLSYSLEYLIWGYFLISFLTSIIFKKKAKKYIIFNLIIFLITGLILSTYYFMN